ncbi:DUF3889 domain-containing protein [Paenibacillus radicis (ex Gao et al. 2016)]|uniref:DUF3889 domain-containing protein n=1 Tax=Paenibacillus radicis (ex Gao et al. 2016) TaxID=1737354 RepID=A0A917M600_9BACL|nr:DUF3889 domain-containing protein [Paenibacillus radicis (ex Gao et al. 2016)]GGG80131.1 hypothetical protein GCM10010918_41510 [Paenibacillus radicis (ex Gao et al. 2016)]
MKRIIILLMLALSIIAGSLTMSNQATALEPDYAKWGKLAVQETASKYGAEIVDYKYEGRYPDTSEAVEERFKLWVRQGAKEISVRVSVHVQLRTNTAGKIDFEKLD